MSEKIRKLTIKQMEPIVREATHNALRKYIWPSGKDERLTLGIFLEDEYGIFELYFDGARPQDAEEIGRAHV